MGGKFKKILFCALMIVIFSFLSTFVLADFATCDEPYSDPTVCTGQSSSCVGINIYCGIRYRLLDTSTAPECTCNEWGVCQSTGVCEPGETATVQGFCQPGYVQDLTCTSFCDWQSSSCYLDPSGDQDGDGFSNSVDDCVSIYGTCGGCPLNANSGVSCNGCGDYSCSNNNVVCIPDNSQCTGYASTYCGSGGSCNQNNYFCPNTGNAVCQETDFSCICASSASCQSCNPANVCMTASCAGSSGCSLPVVDVSMIGQICQKNGYDCTSLDTDCISYQGITDE